MIASSTAGRGQGSLLIAQQHYILIGLIIFGQIALFVNLQNAN
jgi:hypothetical protein